MRNSNIIRVFSAILICFSVIVYNGLDVISLYSTTPDTKQEVFINYEEEKTEKENSTETNKTVKTEEKTEEKEKTENKKEAVSAAANVKGKIAEKYVSPYSASLSYDKVYIKNSTGLEINIKSLLNSELSFKVKKNDSPQVLILHTHATETFMETDSDFYTDSYTSRTTDKSKNMVKIGEIVAKNLNDAGIKTLHDQTLHDYPNYTGSYTRAAETITSYLKKYPSIKVVLDLHRDAITGSDGAKQKLVTKINGKKAAQVMIVMGSQSGTVKNFPNWKENLKLAVRLQQNLEKDYPTLARPLSLTSKNYNESLTKGSMLIEFGTDANSLEEAKYSAEMVANSLIKTLNTN
ncbi:MAG: stage II sporulation protein P [Clostridia bacterium]|nr:stage II sporulation protein P [Clostridia bacterium]